MLEEYAASVDCARKHSFIHSLRPLMLSLSYLKGDFCRMMLWLSNQDFISLLVDTYSLWADFQSQFLTKQTEKYVNESNLIGNLAFNIHFHCIKMELWSIC